MSTKLRGLLVLFGFLLGGLLMAQQKTVTGTVIDESGFPLADVEVTATSGAQAFTDLDGNYSIEVSPSEVMRFSLIGMDDVTAPVGETNVINVTMAHTGAIELEGVVVTAMGISREKKSLGYATQEISGETISAIPMTNFTDALSGEVAGLDIKVSGQRGGSTNMVMRGYSSLRGSNQALIVVDGVPINNNTYNTANEMTGRGGFDYSNAAADINPNDIESINVLKGAAATALYGSRGQNGVVMITTKRGKKGKRGIGVEFNSSYMVGSVDKKTLPKYQKKYGGGYAPFFDEDDVNGDGVMDLLPYFADDASYGPAFDPDLLVWQWNAFIPGLPTYGQPTPWVAARNTPNTIWKTTQNITNSVTFSASNDEGSYRVGFTNMLDEGGLANYKGLRNTLSLGGTYDFSDKLSVDANMFYVSSSHRGRAGTGYDDLNPMQAFRQWWQVNVDMVEQYNAYMLHNENVSWNILGWDNPVPLYFDNYYWTRYQNYQTDKRDRYLGNFTVTYDLFPWLTAMGRFGYDNYNETREGRFAIGSVGSLGSYDIRTIDVSEKNYDIILSAHKDLSEVINIDANLGWNLRVQTLDDLTAATVGGLFVPKLYTLANGRSVTTDQNRYRKMVDGLYARASIGFWNSLFLEGSIRTDRSSALWSGAKNRYWYPSASVSFVFNNYLNVDAINFGKVRFNFARVGNDTDPYNLYNTYILNPGFTSTLGNVGSASNSSTNKDRFLKPEVMEEYEGGLEMAFLKNRISFDVSLYTRKTYDLITPVDMSGFTGYTQQWMNAGTIRNRGIEARLTLDPVKNDMFSWRVGLNFAKNKNKVLELNRFEFLNIAGANFQSGIAIGAQVGDPYGVIRGTSYVYDDNGNKIVGDDGYYLAGPSDSVIGNMNPDWFGGVKNTLTYKNLSMSFLIDVSKGGDVFSLDTYYGFATGLYDNFTSGLNDLGNPVRNPLSEGGGVILPGVKQDGTPNDIRIYAGDGDTNPWGYLGGINEFSIYDASYVKLRNVTLAYTLPDKILNNTFIEKMTISAVGHNLWIIHKNLPYSDPEAGLSAGNAQGYQSGAHPTYREIGLNVKISF